MGTHRFSKIIHAKKGSMIYLSSSAVIDVPKEEEFGYAHPRGGLTFPCKEETFTEVMRDIHLTLSPYADFDLASDTKTSGNQWEDKLDLNDNHVNSVFRGVFEKQKLTGPNFIDWYRKLRIVLSIKDNLNYLEQPLPPALVAPEGASSECVRISLLQAGRIA
ncbi:hypothetical protein Tco_1302213, partial [Tanacetum coccineum]